ncbi:hypothetical protein HG536_0D00190 [Torulaspora globosa]|uniref:Autophagy-related protein 2 n=1 Tax=Torulaspora globosa TaxID=48254 RepID=A0A7G3ZG61_9SACH|nr:uncharacterized protein HG536_0D00190 [Torulaspora globosa]QLL32497.1 hypothetical protein HG536_0D00190 [Torulaspora globosa]
MSSWILQNLQKRLLLYAVQQISILSNVDISNLHVSLGSSSRFTFDDLDLAVDELNIPQVTVESGTIKHLDLQLTVSGGVSIKGNGVEFVLRPVVHQHKGEPNTFSLTKSIQNLTSSIMQFSEPGAELQTEVDAAETGGGGIANSSGSISSSGEESETVPNVGTLENMRNKLLNVALSKLMISFEDLKVRFVLEDDSVVEVSLGSFDFQSEKDDLRNIALRRFTVGFAESQSACQSRKDMDSLLNSVTYTQNEAASLYMSAMESLQAEASGEKSEEELIKLIELVTWDEIEIKCQGLSSVDDLNLRDIDIHAKQLDIQLHKILALKEPVWDMLVRSAMHVNQNSEGQPTSLAGYKRFQKEQSLSEMLQKISIELGEINFHFSDLGSLSLKHLNYAIYEGERQEFEIGAVEFIGDGIVSTTSKEPILQGHFKNDEASVTLLDSLAIKLNLTVLEQFAALLQRGQQITYSLNKKMLIKKHPRRVLSHERKYHITAEPISLTLVLGEYEIRLNTEGVFSDLFPTVFRTNAITVERLSRNGNEIILRCQDVSLITSRSRVQLNYHDESLEESLLTSRFVCKIDDVIIKVAHDKLNRLIVDTEKIGEIFGKIQHESGEKVKKEHMKRSVRILQSSNIMYKNTELAIFALVVNKLTAEVRQFLNQDFGSLAINIDSIMSAVTEDGNTTAFCKRIECNRLAPDINENVIKPIKLSDADSPLVYVCRKSGGKLKVTLTNLAFTYYARWLDIFKATTKNNSSQSKQGESRNDEQLEVKVLDSSLILRPYRLNAALALVIDQLLCTGKSPFDHIKCTLKSGSLLLIDDFSSVKTLEDRHWPSLPAFYARQGFSAIGRYELMSARINSSKPAISLKLKCHNIVASLCADSAHTLTQVCIDLKYPLTFPDDQKYNYSRDQSIDTFKDIDLNFFNSSHIRQEVDSYNRGEEELIHINDDWETNEPSLNDSLSDATNQTVDVQEAYLDVVQELRTTAAHENQKPIDLNLELEIDKIMIKLFDGYDWKFTRKSISRTIDRVDQQMKAWSAEPNSTNQMSMTIFDSIYVSANASDTVDLQKRVNDEIQGEDKSPIYVRKANLHPSRHYKAAVQLDNLRLVFKAYDISDSDSNTDTSAEQVNEAVLTIHRFDIIDNVPTSTWKKFLTLLRHEQWPLDRPMVRLDLATYRPMSYLMATELTLGVEFAPLRLHIDQDALDFLIKFGEFKDSRFELIDEYPDIAFIQKFTTNSVKLKLDYKPKKVDYSGLRSGHASELMNFFILDGSNITLKGIVLYGINGFTELNAALKAVWTPDITSRQIPGVLEGFAPIKSILALGSGVKALVGSPATHSIEDGPAKGGLKKGCNVFVRTATGDFVRLGAKLAAGTQTVLENAEQMLGGDGSNGRMYKFDEPALDMNSLLEEDQLVGGSNPQVKGRRPAALVIDPSAGDEGEPKIVSLYADQPLDIHMGLEEAYHSLEKHMHLVYDVVWRTKGELRERDAGAAAAAVSVAKVAPVAIIRPLIGATEAVAKALQGISNHFDKEQIDDINDKYKSIKLKK